MAGNRFNGLPACQLDRPLIIIPQGNLQFSLHEGAELVSCFPWQSLVRVEKGLEFGSGLAPKAGHLRDLFDTGRAQSLN